MSYFTHTFIVQAWTKKSKTKGYPLYHAYIRIASKTQKVRELATMALVGVAVSYWGSDGTAGVQWTSYIFQYSTKQFQGYF
jgi:hypothetical protein